MSERRNPAIIRFGLVFTLAIALAAIGLVIILDYLFREGSINGRISLAPGGGLISLLISASLLALVFRRLQAASVLALVTIVVALGQVALPHIPIADGLIEFAVSPPLAFVTVLIGLTLIAAIHLRKARLVCLTTGPLVAVTGLFSLMSYWMPVLQQTSLGTIPESTIIVSPLAILVGLSLTFLHTIHHWEIPDCSPALVLISVSAIALTTVIWDRMRVQNSNNLIDSAQALVDQLTASTEARFSADLALIRRLADRQSQLTGPPGGEAWAHDVQSYLNDFPHIRLIGILEPDRKPVGVYYRADNYQYWLQRLLSAADNTAWLKHVTNTRQPQLSPPQPGNDGDIFAMIATPVFAETGQPWHVIAITDLEDIFHNLLEHYAGSLNARIYYGDTVVYDYSSGEPGADGPEAGTGEKEGQKIPLVTGHMDTHYDSQWQIQVYMRQGALTGSAIYLPPLVLFTGLILSFLVVLSHLFWRESERRSQSLRILNDTVSTHLDKEQSLRHINERIMQFSRDILCSINAEGIFTSVNPAVEEILGYRPDQLIGQYYNVLIPPEDQDATAEEMRKLIAGERRISDDFRNHLRHRDGQIVTLSWTTEWSEEDQALFCVGRDMTDQLAAETLMRERDQFFSLSPDMFCIVDLNNHFFEVNRAFEVLLGYEREELLGTSYLELIFSDDRARVKSAVESMMEGNTISDLQIRVTSKDNTEHWLELSAILSSDDLIYVAARDTTEIRQTQEKLKESERLLNIAERAAGIGGWVIDLVTGQIRWSHAMFDIHELPFGELPTFEEALEFYTPGSREIVTKAVESCIQTGASFDEELQIHTRHGRLRWVRVIGQAVRNDEGQIMQIQGALQDITASHQIRAELERSNRELQDFAFVASHDLQEPLRKIQAFSDRLLTRSGKFDDQEQDYLQRMQSAAKRMQSLIQDLLTYSRVTTRAQPLTVCDTNQILAEVLQDMETTISRENAVIDIMPLPAITGDATQLRQVFQNLLSNAIKFHSRDEIPKVSIRAEDETTAGWILVFDDKGVGFDEGYADKLFHPFQKLHREDFPGTGIGMAIVKKILDRHGATVSVRSGIDQGTRFRIFFPTGNHSGIDSDD